MFKQTGVVAPELDVAAMEELATAYSTLASGLGSARATTHGAVQTVLANNEGPAAAAFERSETGSGSIASHLEELAAAAHRTQRAYRDAARVGGTAVAAMHALASDRNAAYWRAIFSGADPHAIAILVHVTRTDLLSLEAQGVTGIETAFSHLDLPTAHVTSSSDERGHLAPGIDDEWQDLYDKDPQLVRDILQQMADEYAEEHGIPPITITFTSIPSSRPGWVTYGDYNSSTGRLRLNEDLLDNPEIMINTIIHEMEHARQYHGMSRRWPWSPDVMGGMSSEEAERWRELNDDYVRNKGGDPDSYKPRPIEVGARDAGRDYVNNLTLEEFREYL